MKNTTKRVLAFVCAAMMVLSLAIVPASADTDKVLNISVGSGLGTWGWTGISSSSITATTAFDEYTVSTKFNLANYEANGSGYGRPLVLYFGGSAYLALNVQANGAIKLYDTSTSNWGGTAAPAGDTLLATVASEDWTEVTARVYKDAGTPKIDWTIDGTTTTVTGRKGFTAVTAVTGAPYFLLDTAVLTTMGGGGTWTADFDLGLDYVNFSYKANDAVTEINEDFDTATAVEGSFPTFSDKAIYSKLSGPDFDITIADDPTYVAVDKYISFSPGSGGAHWSWAGIRNTNITNATVATEYTISTKVNLSNYQSPGYFGRPIALRFGNNALLALNPQANGSTKLYDTTTTDWGGANPKAGDTLVGTIAVDAWAEITARVYMDNGAMKVDYTVDGTTTTVAARLNPTAVQAAYPTAAYGDFCFLLDTGFCHPTMHDFDLGIDYLNATYKTASGDITIAEEFATGTSDPNAIVGSIGLTNGTTVNAHYNSIGTTGYIEVKFFEEAAEEEGGEEDDWVEPAIDKFVKFTKDATHGGWAGTVLLTNKANDDTLTVSEYTTSFRFMCNGPSGNDGDWAGRPFGIAFGDGSNANTDFFSISSRNDGKVYIYMSDNMDWGGTVPIPSKCAYYTADPIGTFNQGEWIDAEVRVYATDAGIRYDVKLNGTTVLTGWQGEVSFASPMPMKTGGYFALSPGIGGTSTEFALDYVKVEYEGSPEWMINEFKDAEAAEGFAAMTLRNNNKWVWGAGAVYTTTVLDDLTGVNYTATLSGDANAFVQAFGEAAPHTAAADVAVPALDAQMKVYAFAKAGYKVVGYKVDGGEVTPIIANDANLYTIPVAADCAVQFVTEAMDPAIPAVARKTLVVNDKYINFSLNPECGGGSWWQSTIRATALPYGTEFDSYILEYKFKISDIVSSDLTKDRYVTLNMGNNALGIMPEEDAGKVHIYLTVPGSEIVDHFTTDAYLTTVAPDEWVEVKVHVYQEGAKVLTNVTANGNTKSGLDINKMNGSAYKYAAPTPQVQENGGHGPYILQIDGLSAASSHKRGYNLAFDYVNLYAGDYTYEWDFADAYMSGNQIKWTGGDQGSNNFGAFTHSVVEDAEVVNTALAAGYAAAVRDGFGGVSVIAKASGATEFGIILSPTVIESLTVADLANYYITNHDSDSDIHAFKAFAQGTDGRFGVKVLGSEADQTYFANGRHRYVYVYAVNGNAVDFAAVNEAGFTFN